MIDPERKKKLAKRIGWLVAKVMIGDLTKNHSKRKQKRFHGGGLVRGPYALKYQNPNLILGAYRKLTKWANRTEGHKVNQAISPPKS